MYQSERGMCIKGGGRCIKRGYLDPYPFQKRKINLIFFIMGAHGSIYQI